jgi:hypothetical protein
MAEVDTEDRPDLIEAFARAGSSAQVPATVPAAGLLGGGVGEGLRVVGAQQVAVHRDEGKVLARLKVLAAAAGDAWYYRWPVKNKKTGKTDWIEGPTIALANDVSRTYGNDEVDTRVVDLGDSWLIYARFTDYETGYSLTRPFQQRKSQRTMGDDPDRQRDIAFQIGCSKAIRNVICNALTTFADFAFQEAKNSLVDKIGRDLPKWRARTIEKLEAKVDVKRVEAVLGRVTADWLAPDVASIIAMMKAIQDGMATLDETFPPLAPAEPSEPAPGTIEAFANSDSDGPTSAGTAAKPDISSSEATAGGSEPPQSPAAKSKDAKGDA